MSNDDPVIHRDEVVERYRRGFRCVTLSEDELRRRAAGWITLRYIGTRQASEKVRETVAEILRKTREARSKRDEPDHPEG